MTLLDRTQDGYNNDKRSGVITVSHWSRTESPSYVTMNLCAFFNADHSPLMTVIRFLCNCCVCEWISLHELDVSVTLLLSEVHKPLVSCCYSLLGTWLLSYRRSLCCQQLIAKDHPAPPRKSRKSESEQIRLMSGKVCSCLCCDVWGFVQHHIKLSIAGMQSVVRRQSWRTCDRR